MLISPSIIAGDLASFGTVAEGLDPAVVDLLHMDVMDGHFVPNLTFGPGYIAHLKRHCRIPLDVHLMIERPELSLEEYLSLEPWCVTIHYESTRFPVRLLSLIRNRGVKAGLAINPATPVESIADLLPCCDLVLIMSVDPGFYGQPFMETALPRIEKCAALIRGQNAAGTLIQVDGGIHRENISRVVRAGASVIVAGNAVFKGGDIHAAVRDLKKGALG
ncbi:MAG: ribulose-phosphate 3-epimerase [Spirochaetes bacterium]|nr:ribulose-phosphate 3-epimerase [Spirochaetota bacterium]